MPKRAVNVRKIVIATSAGAVIATAVFFGALAFMTMRTPETTREDELLTQAQNAEVTDDAPFVEECYAALAALAPGNERYRYLHYHALVRVRDFKALAAYTNSLPVSTEFSPEEWRIEELLAAAWQNAIACSNATAIALYEEATNLNYYAATPYLVTAFMAAGRLDNALDTARAYIRRFPDKSVLVQAADLAALAAQRQILDEVRGGAATGDSAFDSSFRSYCDALDAWIRDDRDAMRRAIGRVSKEIATPTTALLRIEAAIDKTSLEEACARLLEFPPLLDYRERAASALRNFIAAHFPGDLTSEEAERLAKIPLRAD